MKKRDRFTLLSDGSIWILERKEKKKQGNRLQFCCLTGPRQGQQRLISKQAFAHDFRKAKSEEIEAAFKAHKPPSKILGADGQPFDADKAKIIVSG